MLFSIPFIARELKRLLPKERANSSEWLQVLREGKRGTMKDWYSYIHVWTCTCVMTYYCWILIKLHEIRVPDNLFLIVRLFKTLNLAVFQSSSKISLTRVNDAPALAAVEPSELRRSGDRWADGVSLHLCPKLPLIVQMGVEYQTGVVSRLPCKWHDTTYGKKFKCKNPGPECWINWLLAQFQEDICRWINPLINQSL